MFNPLSTDNMPIVFLCQVVIDVDLIEGCPIDTTCVTQVTYGDYNWRDHARYLLLVYMVG